MEEKIKSIAAAGQKTGSDLYQVDKRMEQSSRIKISNLPSGGLNKYCFELVLRLGAQQSPHAASLIRVEAVPFLLG
jgi:hypothetical protein